MFFEIYKDQMRRWRWRLKAGNGRILADGVRSQNSANLAKTAVRHAEANMADHPPAAPFEIYKDKKGEWRWRLTPDDKIVAESSESYTRRANVRRMIAKICDAIGQSPELLEVRLGERK